jgi:cytochrome c oxidase accessory protein FixG
MDDLSQLKVALPQDTAAVGEGSHRLEVEAVNSAASRALYKARVQIYPKLVHGRFRAAKWAVMAITLGVYYLLPWLRWPRGANAPDQAVLVDFAHQRFYFFFIEIWPQEVYYITGLLILAALALFLVTALFGRVWCGYACPQTVWTDLYIAVERIIEGDRASRIRLAKEPWRLPKIVKKISKHAIWLVIAAATGGAWIFYFHDAPSLARTFFEGTAPLSAYIFFGLLTFTTYTLAGTMREQVCTYMCPWPRIQAALTDEEALNVTYRRDRGEPRGAHKKGQSWDGRGDCIDCRQCVAACPMGIDIRDGAQLECIGCALCIDACDDIMVKVDRPRGLIAYDTDLNIARRAKGERPVIRLVRPRTVLYAVLLTVVGLVMLFALTNRATTTLNVLRERNPAFVRMSDGAIRNGYTVKLVNRTTEARHYSLSVEGPEGVEVRAAALGEGETLSRFAVEADRLRPIQFYLTLAPGKAAAPSLPITVVVRSLESGESVGAGSVFLTGAAAPQKE